jgi:hypothetical protein
MGELFFISSFVESAVTCPGCKSLKYLLNVAAYNPLTSKWQTVGRVMMTSLKTASYKNAFNHLLHEVTLAHPEFNNGSDIRAWVVDFSEA